jgi:hypothetical protein
MDARVLHARSGVTLEVAPDEGEPLYTLTSLRLREDRTFHTLSEAEHAFQHEVDLSERDPGILSRLGGA